MACIIDNQNLLTTTSEICLLEDNSKSIFVVGGRDGIEMRSKTLSTELQRLEFFLDDILPNRQVI